MSVDETNIWDNWRDNITELFYNIYNILILTNYKYI